MNVAKDTQGISNGCCCALEATTLKKLHVYELWLTDSPGQVAPKMLNPNSWVYNEKNMVHVFLSFLC